MPDCRTIGWKNQNASQPVVLCGYREVQKRELSIASAANSSGDGSLLPEELGEDTQIAATTNGKRQQPVSRQDTVRPTTCKLAGRDLGASRRHRSSDCRKQSQLRECMETKGTMQ